MITLTDSAVTQISKMLAEKWMLLVYLLNRADALVFNGMSVVLLNKMIMWLNSIMYGTRSLRIALII